MERGQRIAIPLKGTHLSSGTLHILLQDNGQEEVHYAVAEDEVCSTRPCGRGTVDVDKGYTEAYTDSDGERHGEGLGDLMAAESDHGKDKGRKRNQLKAVHDKHAAKGNHRTRPATSSGTTWAATSGTNASADTTRGRATCCARPSTPSWTRRTRLPARSPHP